jgi:glutathione synthase/RimK-type ligase-like ATP-grasp enzyme
MNACLRAMDKQATTALAASLGVATPETALLGSEAEAAAFARTARYPLVLKPRSSEEKTSHGAMRATGKPLYAGRLYDLGAAFRELASRSSTVLAQEYVEGTGTGYFALMNRGSLRAEFAHRRIRDVRPTGSGQRASRVRPGRSADQGGGASHSRGHAMARRRYGGVFAAARMANRFFSR